MKKSQTFDQNNGLNPLEKMPILMVCKTDVFCCSERLVCYIKRGKSFVHDLFSRSITWKYRGLEGVTRGYRGLQEVTRGYRGLQEVTRGDRG